MFRPYPMILAAALGAGSPALAQTTTTELKAVSGAEAIDKTTITEDIRFKSEGYERMTVPVLLSGTGPYRFLVDTGADRTAISRQLASRLKLSAGESVALHSATGVSSVTTAKVPSIQLTRKSQKIANAPLLDSMNMGADGILGTDSLASQRVVFDFASQTMSIVPSSAPDFHDEPGTVVVEARRRNGRLIVTDANANGRRVTVVLDTGSQVTIGNEALRRSLQKGDLLNDTQPVEIMSVTGEKLMGEYMFLRRLEIGGVTLEKLAVVFAPAHTFHQLKLDEKPALLLGMNAIRAFKKVSIDFANKRFRVILRQTSELQTEMALKPWLSPPVARR
jgi:predicted aspartyl protease